MGSAFHQLCPRYSGTLTPTAPTAIRLWETFTFTFYVCKDASLDSYFLFLVMQEPPVAQWVKHWPTNLAAPGLSPA